MAELVQLIKLTIAARVRSYEYEEEWKLVVNACVPRKCFELPPGRYRVSNHGRIVSVKFAILMNPTTRQRYKCAKFRNGLENNMYRS